MSKSKIMIKSKNKKQLFSYSYFLLLLFKQYMSMTLFRRLYLSSLYGKILRAVYQFFRTCARRNNPVELAEDLQGDARF